jgi:dephospho-CoA kinase
VSRDVVSAGSEGLALIIEAFGSSMQHDDGTLNRDALGTLVLQDSQARAQLESITHPRIRAEIAQRAKLALDQGEPAVFVEAALLVETGSAKLYPELWVVRCAKQQQVRRLMARKDCTQETAEAWIGTQMPVEEKAKHATVIIDNDSDLNALQQRVSQAYSRLMEQLQDQG